MAFLFYWEILYFGVVPLTALVSVTVNSVLIHAMRSVDKWDTTTTAFFVLTTSDLCHASLQIFGSGTRIAMFFYREALYRLYPVLMPLLYFYVIPLPLHFSKTVLAVMSIERYFAISRPMKFKRLWTKPRLAITMTGCFVSIVVLGIPTNLFKLPSINDFDTSFTGLEIIIKNPTIDGLASVTFAIATQIIPILIICIFSFAIVITLWKHTKEMKEKFSNPLSTEKSYTTGSPYQSNSKNKTQSGSRYIKKQHRAEGDGPSETSSGASSDKERHDKTVDTTAQSVDTTAQSVDTTAQSASTQSQHRLSASQARITVTMLVISITAIGLFIPGKTVSLALIDVSKGNQEFVHGDFCLGLVHIVELLNSIINSVVFVTRGKKYRDIVKGMLKC